MCGDEMGLRCQLPRGTGSRGGQPWGLLVLEHGEPPQTAGCQGQMDKPMDGQQRGALIVSQPPVLLQISQGQLCDGFHVQQGGQLPKAPLLPGPAARAFADGRSRIIPAVPATASFRKRLITVIRLAISGFRKEALLK